MISDGNYKGYELGEYGYYAEDEQYTFQKGSIIAIVRKNKENKIFQ